MEKEKTMINSNLDQMKKKKQTTIIVVVIALILTNLITFFVTAKGLIGLPDHIVIENDDPVVLDGFKKLNMLEKQIAKGFYEDVDSAALMTGAYRGLFDGLDDVYSFYCNEEEMKIHLDQSSGQFEGIGVLVTQTENKTPLVITAYKDTPAGNAGIQPGDLIITVDGEDVQGKGVNYAVSRIRGEKGTAVHITVVREDQTIDYTLTRDTIDIHTVNSKTLQNNIGYIEITEFIETTGDDFVKAVDELEAQGITGLIIDLRYNGGGLVDSAIQVADRLLGKGTLVTFVDRNENVIHSLQSTDDQIFDKPIVILVNNGSASASEIVTGAFQDRKAATVVGTQTFGKGIVQDVVPLEDGSGFQLTVFKYLTPNGTAIHKVGLTPDVIVEQNPAYSDVLTVPEAEDVQLQKALTLLSK